MKTIINGVRAPGFWCEHPLQAVTHTTPETIITHRCPKCDKKFTGKIKRVLEQYRDHIWDTHAELLEDCGCCGGSHFPEFDGDCREDWERF